MFGIFQRVAKFERDRERGRDQYRVIDNYIKSHLNALEIAVRDFFRKKFDDEECHSHLSAIVALESRSLVKKKIVS